MRPETFVATVESSASILPLSMMMLRGTGGWRIKNHQTKKPPAMTSKRTGSAMKSRERFFIRRIVYFTVTVTLLAVSELPVARCNSAIALFKSVWVRNSFPFAVAKAV